MDFYIICKNVLKKLLKLYNMVRIIVGTLIKVGNKKLKPEDIQDIIREGNRKRAGMVVPPNGLVLEKVFY